MLGGFLREETKISKPIALCPKTPASRQFNQAMLQVLVLQVLKVDFGASYLEVDFQVDFLRELQRYCSRHTTR